MKKNSEGKLEPVPGYLESYMAKIPFLNGAVSLLRLDNYMIA